MPFSPPDSPHPVILPGGTPHAGMVFLSAAIDHPRWQVGALTYVAAHVPSDDWAAHLAPFLTPARPSACGSGATARSRMAPSS